MDYKEWNKSYIFNKVKVKQIFNIPNCQYEQISVTIDKNKYFDGNVYYIQKEF
ncbi:hypothetical protein CM15mP35_10460 [bacterium]|nr:MAG: hypothetical protein CM15mP35_10460 [bacterium]